jgi:hypothetical protein
MEFDGAIAYHFCLHASCIYTKFILYKAFAMCLQENINTK